MKQTFFNLTKEFLALSFLHLYVIGAVLAQTNFPITAQSITPKKTTWLSQQVGLSHTRTFDDGNSLLQYKGNGVQIGVGSEKNRLKSSSQFNTNFAWSPLASASKYVRTGHNFDAKINYTYLRRIPSIEGQKVNFAVGGSFVAQTNVNLHSGQTNNTTSWDGNIGFWVNARANYPFQMLGNNWEASYQLGLPLVVMNHRPNYLGFIPIEAIFDGKEGTSTDWSALGRITTLNNKYFYLTQQLQLGKILSNGNKIRLAYNWSYANNKFASNKYQNLTSGISVGILTKL